MSSYRSAEVWGLGPSTGGSDDEVLAPVKALPSDAVEDETEPEAHDGGFSDAERIVRVWITDDRMSRVRVSTRWRAKLGPRSLGECFAQALMLANLRLAEIPRVEEPSFDHVDFSELPRVTPSSLAAFQERFVEAQRRWDEARDRYESRAAVEPVAVTGKSKGVTVTLNAAGRAAKVSFDDTWLQKADPVSIRSHVMRASDRARAQFVVVDDDRTELSALETEHRFLLTAFQAMLNPKEKS